MSLGGVPLLSMGQLAAGGGVHCPLGVRRDAWATGFTTCMLGGLTLAMLSADNGGLRSSHRTDRACRQDRYAASEPSFVCRSELSVACFVQPPASNLTNVESHCFAHQARRTHSSAARRTSRVRASSSTSCGRQSSRCPTRCWPLAPPSRRRRASCTARTSGCVMCNIQFPTLVLQHLIHNISGGSRVACSVACGASGGG